jgi:hypothetical protein
MYRRSNSVRGNPPLEGVISVPYYIAQFIKCETCYFTQELEDDQPICIYSGHTPHSTFASPINLLYIWAGFGVFTLVIEQGFECGVKFTDKILYSS